MTARSVNLLDLAYRYDKDYTDEALDEIARIAAEQEHGKAEVPILVKQDRNRTEGLPYEQMKLDKLAYGKIAHSSTEEYGEVEIREEGDKVIVSVTGIDDEGAFSAANAYTLEEFMQGEADFLEKAIGSTLFYWKICEEA